MPTSIFHTALIKLRKEIADTPIGTREFHRIAKRMLYCHKMIDKIEEQKNYRLN